MAKGYNITTTLKLNDQMSKGVGNIVKQVNNLNKSLGSMSGQVAGLDNLYMASVTLASGLASASSNGRDLANTLRSVSGAKLPIGANMMSPIPSTPIPSAPMLSGGTGLEKAIGPMGSLKSGYQKLVDYSATLDKNSIGFFRNLRYSMLNTYIIIQGLKSAARILGSMTESVDRYNASLARLNLANSMMNDGLYTTRELQENIYQAAERSRMSYEDMVDFASDMTLQSGHAFKNQAEILKFSELINKSFKASGTSIQSQVSGLYQLKQALASNRLQGDEFRSIIENMPQLTNMLRDSLGMTHAELKKLSSEGGITAEVIKKAVFESEQMIDGMFKAMPKTFGDMMTSFKNIWGKSMWEFKERLNMFLNSAMGTDILDAISGKLERLGAIFTKMAIHLPKIIDGIKQFLDTARDNAGLILTVLATVILNKVLLEAFNSVVKLLTIFSKLNPTTAIIMALAFAISYWLIQMWEAGYTLQEMANAIIDKLNQIYNFLLPIISIISVIISVLTWLYDVAMIVLTAISNLVGDTVIQFFWLVAAIAMVGIIALVAFTPLVAAILVAIGVVLLLIWVVSKIASAVGWAIGTAIGFLWALATVAFNVGRVIGAAFGVAAAVIAGKIAEGIGKALVSFGHFQNSAQSTGNILGDVFIAGVNIAIGALNKLISAINKIPGVNIGTVGLASGNGGKSGAGDLAITDGYRMQGIGTAMQQNAWAELDAAGDALKASVEGFGDTVKSFGDIGKAAGQDVQDWAGGLLGSTQQNPLKHLTDSDLGKFSLVGPFDSGMFPEGMGGGDSPGDAPGGGGGGSGGKPNIGTVDKVSEVDLSDNTMKLLKAMYERDLFQRFINIDSNMQFSFVGTANSDESAKDIAANVDRMVTERLANLLIV